MVRLGILVRRADERAWVARRPSGEEGLVHVHREGHERIVVRRHRLHHLPLPAGATWAPTDPVAYGYNQADILDAVTDFNGNQISITNNGDSLPDSEVLGSTGDTISTTYDSTDSPSAIALKNSSTTLQSFSYSNAPDSSILSETDTPSSSRSPASYTYDGQG